MTTLACFQHRLARLGQQNKSVRRVALLRLEELEERTVPTLLGQQVFPVDNPWNQKITGAPVAASSAAIINNIITTYGDGRLHPDFGQDYHNGNDLYGIPYNVVHGNSTPKTAVVINAYASESDVAPVPLPANAVIEGDFQNGPKPGVNNRGDSHLLIYDVDNNVAYEFYRASRPSENADGKWHADQETVWDMKTNTFRTLGWTSADAAGLSILAGLVRPDEGLPTSQGGQGAINHAIRFTLQNSIILDQFLYPASHVANPGNTNAAIQPPMGARFRLKAGVDISQLNPESRVIAQAMKDYGMIVADNGSNFFFSGASYAVNASNQQILTWDDNDIQDSLQGLKSLHFSDFEVVDLTPAVTGLSSYSGAAGTSVTVTGQNFSGAAGHLQVFFGTAPATSVTVVDDAHVVAVAPAGSGTVDVRVQSGVTTSPNSENIKSTIFGYGVSVVTAGDKFTFGTTSNQAPTVANAAAATPNPVTGLATNLSVLGADDGGEPNLQYSWTSNGPAPVTFSSNGNNAAKNTTATFTAPGSYTFTARITDAGGLSVTSSVSVTVVASNQAPTLASAAAATPNPVTGMTTSLSILGADDGGEPNLLYTWTSGGPAPVTFTVNGSNAAKNTTATFTTPGSYTLTATIIDAGGLSATSSVNVGVTVAASNQAPTVASPAAATPNPVTGKKTSLSVLGADDGGEANLRYTWTSSGPASVRFSANGSNAAKNATATFHKAGSYIFVATIADTGGLKATTTVSVTVAQTLTLIAVKPATATVQMQNKLQLKATALDQFGAALSTQPVFTWTLSGQGSLSSGGLYTAPRQTGGPYLTTATAGGIHGIAHVTVVPKPAAPPPNLLLGGLLANPFRMPSVLG